MVVRPVASGKCKGVQPGANVQKGAATYFDDVLVYELRIPFIRPVLPNLLECSRTLYYVPVAGL